LGNKGMDNIRSISGNNVIIDINQDKNTHKFDMQREQ
jgi:hypothetical protein